ncbi:MAG: hypothetical protein JOS17DRAFT_504874 [Linnemannia elongata]|nr:MAG: hypothetical protein JOS17DRAFT_504874 [Linnemannia elongata]
MTSVDAEGWCSCRNAFLTLSFTVPVNLLVPFTGAKSKQSTEKKNRFGLLHFSNLQNYKKQNEDVSHPFFIQTTSKSAHNISYPHPHSLALIPSPLQLTHSPFTSSFHVRQKPHTQNGYLDRYSGLPHDLDDVLLLCYRSQGKQWATTQQRHQTSSNGPPRPRTTYQQQLQLQYASQLPSACCYQRHQRNHIYKHHGYPVTSRSSSRRRHVCRCPIANVHSEPISP